MIEEVIKDEVIKVENQVDEVKAVNVEGFVCPVDPAEASQCDSCQ